MRHATTYSGGGLELEPLVRAHPWSTRLSGLALELLSTLQGYASGLRHPSCKYTLSKRLVAVCAGHVALTFESEHQSTSYQQKGHLDPALPVPPGFVIYSTALASLGPPRSIPLPPPTSADLVGLISELLSPPSSTNSKQKENNNYNKDNSKGAAGEFQTARISDGDSPPILVIKHGGRVLSTHFLFLPEGRILFACVEQPGEIRFWWWNSREERWKYLNVVYFNTEANVLSAIELCYVKDYYVLLAWSASPVGRLESEGSTWLCQLSFSFSAGCSSNTNSVVSSSPPRKVAAAAEQGHKVGEIAVALKVKLLSEPTVERGIANGPLGRGLWMFTKHRLIWYSTSSSRTVSIKYSETGNHQFQQGRNRYTNQSVAYSAEGKQVWMVGMCAADGTKVLDCYSWTAGEERLVLKKTLQLQETTSTHITNLEVIGPIAVTLTDNGVCNVFSLENGCLLGTESLPPSGGIWNLWRNRDQHAAPIIGAIASNNTLLLLRFHHLSSDDTMGGVTTPNIGTCPPPLFGMIDGSLPSLLPVSLAIARGEFSATLREEVKNIIQLCDNVSACLTHKDKVGGSSSLSPSTITTTSATTNRPTIKGKGGFYDSTKTTTTSRSLMDMLSEIDPLDLGFTRELKELLLTTEKQQKSAASNKTDDYGGRNAMSTTVSSINLPHMKDISGNILLAFFCQSAVSAEDLPPDLKNFLLRNVPRSVMLDPADLYFCSIGSTFEVLCRILYKFQPAKLPAFTDYVSRYTQPYSDTTTTTKAQQQDGEMSSRDAHSHQFQGHDDIWPQKYNIYERALSSLPLVDDERRKEEYGRRMEGGVGGRYDEEELEVNEEKGLLAVQHQMHHQRLHARVALHLAVGQYVIGCRLLLSCRCPSSSSEAIVWRSKKWTAALGILLQVKRRTESEEEKTKAATSSTPSHSPPLFVWRTVFEDMFLLCVLKDDLDSMTQLLLLCPPGFQERQAISLMSHSLKNPDRLRAAGCEFAVGMTTVEGVRDCWDIESVSARTLKYSILWFTDQHMEDSNCG
eukprot:145382_1